MRASSQISTYHFEEIENHLRQLAIYLSTLSSLSVVYDCKELSFSLSRELKLFYFTPSMMRKGTRID